MNPDRLNTGVPWLDSMITGLSGEPIVGNLGLGGETITGAMNALQATLLSVQATITEVQRTLTAIGKKEKKREEKKKKKEKKIKKEVEMERANEYREKEEEMKMREFEQNNNTTTTTAATGSFMASTRIPTVQEELETTANPLAGEAVMGPGSQIARNTAAGVGVQKRKRKLLTAVPKAKSPVMTPRAGAGITKGLVPRGLKAVPKAKAKAKAKSKAKSKAKVEAEREVEVEVEEEMKNQSITNITTVDNVAKASSAKAPRRAPQTPRRAPQTPQRRSGRVLERTLKSAQGEPAAASSTAAGVGAEKGKGGRSKAVTKAKSPVLKPKAGVSKGEGEMAASPEVVRHRPRDMVQTWNWDSLHM
ncbi:unnamed protein product [Tuber aestivum]|uniref:Uncharacterized protein n=1 Tax=Tuber aestivum TaxID=59557 RepID=A0A292PXW5_9PEZI|nr:unnamed protein product [Tuber aestivum]